MIQFLGTKKFPVGIVCVVNVVGCPGEKEIHPFEPTQNCVYVCPKKQNVNPMLNGPCWESSVMNKFVPLFTCGT